MLTRLMFNLERRGSGGGGLIREVILQAGGSGIKLILAGYEGHHVVERSCFHRSGSRSNGLWTLCSDGIP